MTDPNPTVRMPVPEDPNAPVSTTDARISAPPPAPPPAPPLTAPASGWAAPPPTSRQSPRNDGRMGSIVFGGILLAVGVWFFLERTIGLDLPDIRWSQFWPVILIVIGGWLVLGSWRNRRS